MFDKFYNAFCAVCGLEHVKPITAKTIGAAIKKATLACNGIKRNGSPTRCATGFYTAPIDE